MSRIGKKKILMKKREWEISEREQRMKRKKEIKSRNVKGKK